MKATQIISFSLACLAFTFGSALGDEIPWTIQSTNEPGPIVVEGKLCHAGAIVGRDGYFMYVPDEVITYVNIWAANAGSQVDSTMIVSSAGRNWKLRHTVSGPGVELMPIAPQRPVAAQRPLAQQQPAGGDGGPPAGIWLPVSIFVGVVVAIIIIIIMLVRLKAAFNRIGAEEELEAAERERRQLKEYESQLARKREELLRDSGALASREAELLASREEMEAEKREQEEKLRRARASMENASQMMQRVPKEGGNRPWPSCSERATCSIKRSASGSASCASSTPTLTGTWSFVGNCRRTCPDRLPCKSVVGVGWSKRITVLRANSRNTSRPASAPPTPSRSWIRSARGVLRW